MITSSYLLVPLWLMTLQTSTLPASCNSEDKVNLTILSLLPYPDPDGEQPSWDEGDTLFLTEKMAIDRLNANPDILPRHNLVLAKSDSGCNIQSKATLSLIRDTLGSRAGAVVGMVGPGCSVSASTVGSLSGREQIALLNVHIAGSLRLADRERYAFSFGTLDSTEVFVEMLLKLMEVMKWKRVSALYDGSRLYYSSTAQLMENATGTNNSTISYFSSAVYDTHIPLSVIRNEYRIILLFVGPDYLSKILCLAHRYKMLHPVYQFVIVSRVASEITPVTFTYDSTKVACGQAEIQQAMHKALIVHYQLRPLNESKPTDAGMSYAEFYEQYERMVITSRSALNTTIQTSFWAPAFFDATWSLGLALNRSMGEVNLTTYKFGQLNNSEIIKRGLLQLRFEGVSGTIRFDESTGYARRNVDIYQINGAGKMEAVGYYNKLNRTISLTRNISIDSEFSNTTLVTTAPKAFVAPVLLVTATGFVLVMILQVLTIHYRNTKPVKAISPKVTQLAFAGCYLVIVACATNVWIDIYTDRTSAQTNCVLWHLLNIAAALGTTLIFGTVCARTWRLYRIFVHFRDPGKLLSERVLIAMVMVFVVMDIVITIAWVATDPFLPVIITIGKTLQEVKEGNSTTDVRIVTMVIHGCTQRHFVVWCVLLMFVNVVFMGGAVVLAFLTRHIQYRDFRTRGIMTFTYVMTGILGLGFGVYTVLLTQLSKTVITARFLVVSLLLNGYVYLSCLLLFLPPLYPLITPKLRTAARKLKTTLLRS